MEIKEEFNKWVEARSGKKFTIKSPLLKATLVNAFDLASKTKLDGRYISEIENRDDVMEMIFGAWKTNSILLIDGDISQTNSLSFQYIPIPKTDNEKKIVTDELKEIENGLNL